MPYSPGPQSLLDRFSLSQGGGGAQYMLIDSVTGDSLSWGGRRGGMPESFRDSKSATWRGNNIIGRSSPIYGYAGSESRDFSVDLDLVASMDYQDGGSPNDVKAACDWLMSFTYPDYSGGAAKPPHTAIFRAAGQVQQRVIVKSVTVAYKPPFDPATGLAYRAKITLSMAEVEDDPKSYDELRAASGEMRF